MTLRLLIMLCAGALSASALAQNPTERQRNVVPQVKDGTSVTLPARGVCGTIPDDAYDGTKGSMICRTIAAPNVPGEAIVDVNVQVTVAHTWVGDLTMKVFPPAGGTPVTLVSRPGLVETADDGSGCCGDSSDLVQTAPITFDEGLFPSAETMGLTEAIVCQSSGICTYNPDAGIATPGSLSSFVGLPADGGAFDVCIGDSGSGDIGQFCDAQIDFTTGLLGDLSITKNAPSGVTTAGAFPYDLAVANAGPADHPGAVVTDVLPAGLAFVGSNCGATAAGQTITWNVGALVNGGSSACQIFVRQTVAGCATITNTATIASTDGTIVDPPGNNTSTYSNAPAPGQLLGDPGFESGSPNASWAETSTNFGTPLCTAALCGTGTGTGPQTGTWWSWFGGAGGALEVGSVEQSVVIPTGTATLDFGFESFVCSGDAADFVRALVDGTEVWRADATGPLCGVLGYSNQSFDVSAFADGGSHAIRFESTTGTNGGASNFFIDNASLNSVGAPVCSAPLPADLSVTISDSPDPVIAGNNLTYVATITNNGTTYAENMALAVTLPAGTSLVSATASNGGVCAGSNCSWAGFTAPGSAFTATVVAQVPASVLAGTVLTGTAVASSLTPDPTPGNNTASTTTTVSADANLVLTLTASTLEALVNEPVTFTATSLNIGPSDAQNLSITVTLTPDFRYGSHTAAGATCTVPQVGTTGAITCTWAGPTPPNASQMLQVVAFSNNRGDTAVNASTVSDTSDPVMTNNTGTVTVNVGFPVEEIPTMSKYSLILLGLMLGLLGFVAVRRNS